MPKPFECKPGVYCKAADCCRNLDTTVSVSVGDYLRLSQLTGEPIVDLWRSKGEIVTLHIQENDGFFVNIALFHDPCPYLSDSLACKAYDARPLDCRGFPYTSFLFYKDQVDLMQKKYRCTRGMFMDEKQKKNYRLLDQIIKEESLAELRFLWPDGVPTFKIKYSSDLADLMTKAHASNGPRQERIAIGAREVQANIKNNEISALVLSQHLPKIIFPIVANDIERRLASLPPEAFEFYKKTTERLNNLRQRMKR